jgi:hypothetical protein
MSQKDLIDNEVIEELMRERANTYLLQNKINDFWILIAPKFVENKKINQFIKESNFYKQKKTTLVANQNPKEFYAAIISSDKEFIKWVSLRLGYFEEVGTNNLSKDKYISNGIYGNLNSNEYKASILASDQKYLYPDLLLNKYKKLLEIFYTL